MKEQDTATLLRLNVESVLDGAVVGCSNVAKSTYELNGVEQTGLTANLALPDHDNWLRLGQGQTFDLHEKTWKVVEVSQEGMRVAPLETEEEQ